MTRKVFAVSVFLLVFVFNIAFGQSSDVKIMSEEIIKWDNKSCNIYHLDLYSSLDDTYFVNPLLIIREIYNYLQVNNYISAVNSTTPQKIDDDQLDWDLGLSGYRGGHPIFEWWNTSTLWKAIKYRNNLYIIRRATENSDFEIYKINIRG